MALSLRFCAWRISLNSFTQSAETLLSSAPSVYALPHRLLYCAGSPMPEEEPQLAPLAYGLTDEHNTMIKAHAITWHVGEKGTVVVTRKIDGKKGHGVTLRQAIEDL